MNATKYRRILYFISLVIALTLAVQGYWAYRTFKAEKLELTADVQKSLDAAVDTYFTELAQESAFSFIEDSLKVKINSARFSSYGDILLDTLSADRIKHINIQDSGAFKQFSIITDSPSFELPWAEHTQDSIFRYFSSQEGNPLETLTSKIMISFTENELSLPLIDSILLEELQRNQIGVDYILRFDSEWRGSEEIGTMDFNSNVQQVNASSSFLMDGDILSLWYQNTTPIILHRNAVSFGLSLLFVACIIFCLVYLLRIIQRQKQLAEIKNDLISNITHEFKTPLATIGVALEGIEHFNTSNDPEKSKKYAAMSGEQVKKLSNMVDKLLETATLDSQRLQLKKEPIDLMALMHKTAVVPEAFISSKKQIEFNSELAQCNVMADRFHLENVCHTIIDNAFKYGGNLIQVSVTKQEKTTQITIADNGTTLTKAQSARIFEKFYRVPKGNNHDVKGFGIGLYYAKNIVEKHGGTLNCTIKNGTTFTLTLPNE